ncbi:acylphosphatase [Bacillus ndiopicus]|uniref:acylphosphatase n=1 Tax=Bacillus ndiopicus TaxID=1347368 RepID=UPI0005A9187E|nr:acylphosphatase [Bacillus ndiopicus]
MKRVRVIFSGDATGTGHRFFIKQKAFELGLKGYCILNEKNNIEAEIEGTTAAVDEFIHFVEQGVSLQAQSNRFTLEIFDSLKGYKTMKTDII